MVQVGGPALHGGMGPSGVVDLLDELEGAPKPARKKRAVSEAERELDIRW